MADLHAWRNAATELPPEGVPVVGILDGGSIHMMTVVYADGSDTDDGTWMEWAMVYGTVWWTGTKWDCSESELDNYRVRYWHPLPTVPTLAELDAAHGAGPAADAASDGGE